MVLDIIVLILIYLFIGLPRWKNEGKAVLLINSLMVIYLGFVLYFTLMPILSALPRIFFPPFGTVNFSLFSDAWNGRGDFIRQICLNILLMVPFGYLYPLVKKEKVSFVQVVVATLMLSLSIEILQPLLHGYRSFDITDLFTNTIGGGIGYLALRITMMFNHSHSSFANQS